MPLCGAVDINGSPKKVRNPMTKTRITRLEEIAGEGCRVRRIWMAKPRNNQVSKAQVSRVDQLQ